MYLEKRVIGREYSHCSYPKVGSLWGCFEKSGKVSVVRVQ